MTVLRALVYPEPLQHFHTLRGLLRGLGWQWTADPDDRFDFAVAWIHYEPRRSVPGNLAHATLTRLRECGVPVVNYDVLGTGKRRVDAVHRETFGYGLLVDPRRHAGPMVVSLERGSGGAMRVVEGPLPAEAIGPQEAHARLIDARAPDGAHWAAHTAIVDGRPTFVTIAYKRPEERFGGTAQAFDLASGSPAIAFSPEEVDRLVAFCAGYGLELGEIEVLRDVNDGRLYVVDVHPTPGSYLHLFDATLSVYERMDPRNAASFYRRMENVHDFYALPLREMIHARLARAHPR